MIGRLCDCFSESFSLGICQKVRDGGSECQQCFDEINQRFWNFIHTGMCLKCQSFYSNSLPFQIPAGVVGHEDV